MIRGTQYQAKSNEIRERTHRKKPTVRWDQFGWLFNPARILFTNFNIISFIGVIYGSLAGKGAFILTLHCQDI